MSSQERPQIDRRALLLSAMRALWGAVPRSLRAVSVQEREGTVEWLCVFDGSQTASDVSLLGEAAASVVSDFPDADFREFYETSQPPAKPRRLLELVFLRAEDKG